MISESANRLIVAVSILLFAVALHFVVSMSVPVVNIQRITPHTSETELLKMEEDLQKAQQKASIIESIIDIFLKNEQ